MKKRNTKWLVINVLCVLLLMGVVILAPLEIIQKRRVVMILTCLVVIAVMIYEYQIQKAARLTWTEPKSVTRLRHKEEILSQFRLTSWSRLLVLLLLVLIPLQLIMPKWYYLSLILLFATACTIFLGYLFFYAGKEIIIMDDSGIRLKGKLRKYFYTKMTAVEISPNAVGGYSLAWQYEGNDISRGISREIDISEIKALIENNAKREVTMRQP